MRRKIKQKRKQRMPELWTSYMWQLREAKPSAASGDVEHCCLGVRVTGRLCGGIRKPTAWNDSKWIL